MARDVHRVLGDILTEHAKESIPDVDGFIDDLMQSGRYQRDIWA